MIGLTDRQLGLLMEAAKPLPPEKRALFLERVGAMLRNRIAGRRLDDDDLIDVTALARRGLMQNTDTAA